MENINDIYSNLTNVDIEKQKQIWDERGKGYYGEYLVFQELYRSVPGYGKILMNLEVPSQYGNNTEIDLVFIHETGIYVFEIKHYKGTIYGKSTDERWTQYFRTVKNSHFYSPLKQNEGHIRALRNILPTAKFTSFIVFTNAECELRVENDNPNVIICKLRDLQHLFAERTHNSKPAYQMEGVDRVFSELLPFSPTMNSPVPSAAQGADEIKTVPLGDYVNAFKTDYQNDVKRIYEDAEKKIKRYKGITAIVVCLAVAVCGLFAFSSNARLQSARDAFETELNAMKKNFQHVDSYNAGNIELADDFIEVTQAEFSASKEYDNATDFWSKIVINTEDYRLKFTSETQFVVMLKDGTVKEYALFPNDSLMNLSSTVSRDLSWNGPVDFGKMVFFNVDSESIEYVKLTHISLCDTPYQNVIKDDIEIELYSAD